MFDYIKTQLETTKHKFWVFYYCWKFCNKLMIRAFKHDFSKYKPYEAKRFATTVRKLKGSTYGSEEYKELLAELKPALDHHYACNRHHPEYHNNGFKDMSELDKIEMVLDWLAATRRHTDGDIHKSLKINQERFQYSNQDRKQLTNIIKEII